MQCMLLKVKRSINTTYIMLTVVLQGTTQSPVTQLGCRSQVVLGKASLVYLSV